MVSGFHLQQPSQCAQRWTLPSSTYLGTYTWSCQLQWDTHQVHSINSLWTSLMVQVNPHRCFIHHKWEDNTGLCDGNHSKLSCCSHKSPGVRTCLPYTLELRKVLKVTGRDTSLRDTSPCIFRALGRHECHQPGGVSTPCSPPHGCVTPPSTSSTQPASHSHLVCRKSAEAEILCL